MEALACGCAIVVSDYPGARDIIEDGVNGYLVAQRSPEELAERICSLLADPAAQQQLGHNGRKHVQEFYDWRVISARFESVFKRCAAG